MLKSRKIGTFMLKLKNFHQKNRTKTQKLLKTIVSNPVLPTISIIIILFDNKTKSSLIKNIVYFQISVYFENKIIIVLY